MEKKSEILYLINPSGICIYLLFSFDCLLLPCTFIYACFQANS